MVRARQRTQAILLSIFAATRAGFGDRAAIADELAHQPPLVVPDARDTWAAQFPDKCASVSPAATIKGGRGAGNESHALHWWCRSARGHPKAARVTSFVVFKAARTGQGRKRMIQVRFNMSVPRARVLENASTRRERSER